MLIERIKVLVANDFSSKCYICESKYFQPTLQKVILVGAKGVDLSTDSNVDYFGLSWYIYLTLNYTCMLVAISEKTRLLKQIG